MNNKKVTIWDSDDSPPQNDGIVYCWNGYAEGLSSFSLLHYVDGNASRLRAKYLAWIYDLGETKIKGKRLRDYFTLEGGLSYWWMTLLAEKSPFKSPVGYAIRILALEEIIIKERFSSIELISGNKSLHECMAALCKSLEIRYDWKQVASIQNPVGLGNSYNRLPNIVHASGHFVRHIFTCWRAKRLKGLTWFGGDKALFFCSYFINLDQKSCSQGVFHSKYWESLPKWLYKRGFNTNWIHHYIESKEVPNTRLAVDWVKNFNQEPDKNGHHAFLETFLSFGILYSVLINWLRLLSLSLRLRSRLQETFQTKNSDASLWTLMENDWYRSMTGAAAVSNLFWVSLFDKAMSEIPHQRLGLYLCENQSWERALIHAWHKHGHGRLIAVVHSTVRFWDTRYFIDPRTFQLTGKNGIPLPDDIAVNGPAVRDAYNVSGYPLRNLIEVEALRYLYLAESTSKPEYVRGDNRNSLYILVLCDYMPKSTCRQIQLLIDALPLLTERCHFIVRPHPACPVRKEDYPSLKMQITNKSLPELLSYCDVAYTSNTTSAAVDAYCFGIPLVSVLEETELNMSPLCGLKGVRYITNPVELGEALCNPPKDTLSIEPYFFLDKELQRWERLFTETDLNREIEQNN